MDDSDNYLAGHLYKSTLTYIDSRRDWRNGGKRITLRFVNTEKVHLAQKVHELKRVESIRGGPDVVAHSSAHTEVWTLDGLCGLKFLNPF